MPNDDDRHPHCLRLANARARQYNAWPDGVRLVGLAHGGESAGMVWECEGRG